MNNKWKGVGISLTQTLINDIKEGEKAAWFLWNVEIRPTQEEVVLDLTGFRGSGAVRFCSRGDFTLN